VVDTDPQGNASHVLLRGEKPRRPTLFEVLTGDAAPDRAIVPTHLDGVDVLPADASLADATVVLAAEVGRERRLREALDGVGVGGAYDFVLVDTAPTRSLLTTNVLNAVHELIVPFTPGLFGVLGLGQLQGDVAQVRRFLENKTLRIGGIVLAQVEKNNVHRELEDQLRAMFGALVFAAKIPRSIKVEEAHARHESVLTYAPKSIGAAAYKALAREITAHGQRQADRHDDPGGDPPAHHAA
jgi:chromosome partitioning protein